MSKRNNRPSKLEEMLRSLKGHEYVHYMSPEILEPYVEAADTVKEKIAALEGKVKNPDLVFIADPESITGMELLNQCHMRLDLATSYEDLLDASMKMVSALLASIPEDKYAKACSKLQDRFMPLL